MCNTINYIQHNLTGVERRNFYFSSNKETRLFPTLLRDVSVGDPRKIALASSHRVIAASRPTLHVARARTREFSSGRTINRNERAIPGTDQRKIHFIKLITVREEGVPGVRTQGKKGGIEDTRGAEGVGKGGANARGRISAKNTSWITADGTAGAINERALHRKPISPIFSQLYDGRMPRRCEIQRAASQLYGHV